MRYATYSLLLQQITLFSYNFYFYPNLMFQIVSYKFLKPFISFTALTSFNSLELGSNTVSISINAGRPRILETSKFCLLFF